MLVIPSTKLFSDTLLNIFAIVLIKLHETVMLNFFLFYFEPRDDVDINLIN